LFFSISAAADVTVKEADDLVDEEGLGAGEVGKGIEHDGLCRRGGFFLVWAFGVDVDVGKHGLGVDKAVCAVADDA